MIQVNKVSLTHSMMQNAEVPPFVDAMEMPQNELRDVVQIDSPVPINGAPVVPPYDYILKLANTYNPAPIHMAIAFW